MRLYVSPSPFVRKVRVVVREKGLADGIEEIAVPFPYKEGDQFLAVSPLGQVPALVLDDGMAMTDSPVICAYLDSIGSGPRLLPPEGPEHWRVRRLETLGDGALEMGAKWLMEQRRPEGERSPTWQGYWIDGLKRALDQAQAAAPPPTEPLTVGAISLAMAGLYIDYRKQMPDWRSGWPKFAAFVDAVAARPSFVATADLWV